MSASGPKRTFYFALHMSAFGGKADIQLKSRNDCYLLWCVNGERSTYAPLPLSSLIVVVAVVVMMMTPIAVTRIIPVGAVATVVVRSPPAPAIGIADQSYLRHVRSAVCRDWCDRHCSRCGRC